MIANNILYKGQNFDLRKEQLKIARIGIEWKSNKIQHPQELDIELISVALTSNGKIPDDNYFIFYNSELKAETPYGLRSYSGDGSIIGPAQDSCEKLFNDDKTDMYIIFDQIWEGITSIIFAICIIKYPNDKLKDKKSIEYNFSMINDIYVNIYEKESNKLVIKCPINIPITNEDFLILGSFTRISDYWEFKNESYASSGGIAKAVDRYT